MSDQVQVFQVPDLPVLLYSQELAVSLRMYAEAPANADLGLQVYTSYALPRQLTLESRGAKRALVSVIDRMHF